MTAAALKLVHTTPKPKAEKKPKAPLTIAQQLAKLQRQQKRLTKENVVALLTAMDSVAALAAEIAEGGDAYPPGIRDIAERFAERTRKDRDTAQAIADRLC